MALEIAGWLTLKAAAERLGVDYPTAREMVHQGVFTRGRFTSDKRSAPIYIRVAEITAWLSEGVAGVRRVQEANRTDAVAATLPGHGPELGENGAG